MRDSEPKIDSRLLMVLGIMFMSFSPVIVKLSTAPSSVMAFYRMAATVLIMLPRILITGFGEIKALKLSDILMCTASGVCMGINFAMLFEALRHTSVASCLILTCLETVFCALGYRIFMKGRTGLAAVGAIAITFAGSIIIGIGDFGTGRDVIYGDLLAVGCTVFAAAYTLLGARQREKMSAPCYNFFTYIPCAAVLALFNVAKSTPLFGYGYKQVVYGVIMAVVCTVLGHNIINRTLKYLNPTFVSNAKLLSSVFASFYAFLIFGEVPTATQIIGGLIVFAGVILYSRLREAK